MKPGQRFEKLHEDIYLFEDTCNVYVVKSGDRCILIDSGSGKVFGHLGELGVSKVEYILHTHHHRDQTAGSLLCGPGTKVLVPAREEKYFAGAEAFWDSEPLYIIYNLDSRFNTVGKNIPVHGTLEAEDLFQWNKYTFKALDTPGHTKGALSYYLETDGTGFMFIGDLAASPSKIHNFYDLQWNYPPAGNYAQYIESLKKANDYAPKYYLPSHGKWFKGGKGALQGLISKVESVRDALQPETAGDQRQPGTEVLPGVFFVGGTSYLLKSKDGAGLMYDYGYVDIWAVRKIRREFGVRNIEAITISHYHDDHLARIPELMYGELKGELFWVFETISEVIEEPLKYNLPCTYPVNLKPGRIIKNGERIKWHEYELAFVHQPGQTHYHTGMFVEVEGKRLAFTGDNIWPCPGRLRGPIIFKNKFSLNNYLSWIDDMISYNPDYIVPAHYGVFPINRDMLKEYRQWVIDTWAALEDLVYGDMSPLGLDPFFFELIPYSAPARAGMAARRTLRIAGSPEKDLDAEVTLNTWGLFRCSPEKHMIRIPRGESAEVSFEILIPDDFKYSGRRMVSASVTLNGVFLGDVCETILDFGKE